MDGVECWHKDGVFVSKAHPYRAAKECLFGWACYESTVIGPGHIGERKGVTDGDGVLEWLSGRTPEKFFQVKDE